MLGNSKLQPPQRYFSPVSFDSDDNDKNTDSENETIPSPEVYCAQDQSTTTPVNLFGYKNTDEIITELYDKTLLLNHLNNQNIIFKNRLQDLIGDVMDDVYSESKNQYPNPEDLDNIYGKIENIYNFLNPF